MAAVAIAASFCGCNKMEEGVFNPKQKLVEVYQESSDNNGGSWQSRGKELAEAYTWNGKVLESIAYVNGTVVETFQYDDKNRISGSTIIENAFIVSTITTKYVYDEDELEEINVFENGTLISSYEFEHEDGKISRIEVNYPDTKSACPKALQYADPLRRVMPKQIAENMNRVISMAAAKGNNGIYFDFEWDGKNISAISSAIEEMTFRVTYKYDNKSNPYSGLFDIYSITSNMVETATPLFSKNNPVEISVTMTGIFNDSYSVNVNYQYDGKYPISSTMETPVVSYNYQYNEATGEYETVETEYQQRTVTTYVYAK